MTKENILALLKNKYKNLGLSDEILGAQSDFLLSQNPTEETIEAMIGGVEPVLKSFQSNLDKLRKPTPPTPTPTPPAPPKIEGDEIPAWAKALNDKIDSIANQNANKSKNENLIASLTKAEIPEKFFSKFLKTVDFGEGYDENAVVETFKSDFNDLKQTFVNEEVNALGGPIVAPQSQAKSTAEANIDRLA